jgi:hypothetical protein
MTAFRSVVRLCLSVLLILPCAVAQAASHLGEVVKSRGDRQAAEALATLTAGKTRAGERVQETLEGFARRAEGERDRARRDLLRQAVAQVLVEAVHPDAIRQGEHNTCGLASAQIWLAAHDPAEFVRIVAGLALGEEVKLAGGTVLQAPVLEISGDSRTVPSRLFQDALMELKNRDRNTGELTGAAQLHALLRELSGASVAYSVANRTVRPADVARWVEERRPTAERPVLVLVDVGSSEAYHWLAVIGVENGTYRVTDPNGGQGTYRAAELQGRLYTALDVG